jgi:diguanylate cyclase
MTLDLPTLLFVSILMLAMSAGVMTLFGLTGRVYRGFWWWVGAQWALALGLLLHVFRDSAPSVLPAANLLVLQWPVVVLAGLRRFYSRHEWRVPAMTDWLLLGGAYLLWLASWAAHASVATRVIVFSSASCVLYLYAAWMASKLPDFGAGSALKVFVFLTLFGAATQALRVLQGGIGSDSGAWGDQLMLASGLLVVTCALVMVYLGLLLTCERTETNLRITHRKLRFLADTDVLTGVPNRRHFHERAAQTLAQTDVPRSALLMFDIDHFKHINDLLGHAMGDEALRQVALCTRETLRSQDVAGRLGGDEFGVLLPGTSINEAMAVAARIVSRLEDRQVAPRTAPLSLSFGVVQMHAGETIDDGLRRADQALYEAKRQGRSRAVAATGAEDRPVFGESRPLGLSVR